MRTRVCERVLIYSALLLAIALAVRGGSAGVPGAGAALAGGTKEIPAPRIAVCALYRIADELMETDRFKPERVELENNLRDEELKPLYEQLRELQKRLEGMDQKDPAFAGTRERYFRLQNQARNTTQEITQKVERKVAEQLEQCYQLVRASAAAIAEDMGFNFVLASNSSEEALKKETVVSLVRDMMGRPVLLAPKEADITEDVRQDLKLE